MIIDDGHGNPWIMTHDHHVLRKYDASTWAKVHVMFDVSNTKNTWYGLKVPVGKDQLVSAKDLVHLGKDLNVAVLGNESEFASIFADANINSKATFAPVKLSELMSDFRLTFFGHVGLEGKSTSMYLTSELH